MKISRADRLVRLDDTRAQPKNSQLVQRQGWLANVCSTQPHIQCSYKLTLHAECILLARYLIHFNSEVQKLYICYKDLIILTQLEW